MDESRHQWELGSERLRRLTNPASLGFETTRDLPAPRQMVGQARAEEAIDFAVEIQDNRYNLYVSGQPGTGRRTAALAAVERVARERPAAQDWCYVCNFDLLDEPHAVALPTGLGRPFAQDVEAYVLACRRALRRAFSGEDYDTRREAALKDIQARHEQYLEQLQQEALALGFLIRATDSELAVIPVKPRAAKSPDGVGSEPPAGGAPEDLAPLAREEFEALPVEEQQRLRANRERVDEIMARILPQLRALEEEARARVRALDREVTEQAIEALGGETSTRYAASADAVEFLRCLRVDIIAHADVLRTEAADDEPTSAAEGGAVGTPAAGATGAGAAGEAGAEERPPESMLGQEEDPRARPAMSALLRRYRVTVLIAHKAGEHAPVVEEMNPTRTNLLGRIEVGLRGGGVPFTDHTMIKPGALHRANGGFLIIHARDLITSQRGWETLKRTLRFGVITTEINGDGSAGPASATLRPEPIPADIRVVLIGDRGTYLMLAELDVEFSELFKVRADFDVEMRRTPEHERAYALFAGQVATAAGGPPLNADAVARLIQEGSRWAEDQERLSALFGELRDLTTEACYWARKERAPVTDQAHVRQAIAMRERRRNLIPDRIVEQITDGLIAIDTDGEVVGQINGLTVRSSNDFSLGMPARITARTAPGFAGVVNIERETQLSGPAHTKGVLILSGFLIGRFAQESPHGLFASLCFEQE